jgi:hypothetical protein
LYLTNTLFHTALLRSTFSYWLYHPVYPRCSSPLYHLSSQGSALSNLFLCLPQPFCCHLVCFANIEADLSEIQVCYWKANNRPTAEILLSIYYIESCFK